MSDHEDLYLNEFFSTFPLPDSPSLLPFLSEDLESQPLEHPNSYVPSGTFDYSVPFAEADGGVFMSETQTLAPALHDPASLVDDGTLVDFSAWINETPSDFLDPSLLGIDCYDLFPEPRNDMSFADSSIYYREAGPLNVTDLEQPESAPHSIPPPGLEDLELMETQNSIPFESELAIPTASTQSNNTTTLQKRPLLGPTREWELPRKKKRGTAAGMTQAKQGSRTKKGNVCITCRKRKQKCNGEVPCNYCLENLGSQLLKEPCTRLNFLDIVEEKSCFEFSISYQDLVIEKHDSASFLELFTTINGTLRDRLAQEMGLSFPSKNLGLISWKLALSQFQAFLGFVKDEKRNGINYISSLPTPASIIKKTPVIFKERFKEMMPQHSLNHKNLDQLALLTHRLLACGSHCTSCKTNGLTGIQLNMSHEKVAQAAAQLIGWLAVRDHEIEIFSYLQKPANKLNTLSTSDLYDFIALLVTVVWIYSVTSDSLGVILPPKQKSLDQETIKQLTNHRQRLLLALLFHADIAISKLPSWSRSVSWKELEKRIRFIKHKFRHIFINFDPFWSLHQVKNERISTLLSRISPPFENPKQLDPEDFDGQCCLDCGCHRNGAFDKEFEKFDLLYMDGLLSKTMPGGFYEVQVSMVFTVASVDWQLAVARISSRSFGAITLNDLLFEWFTKLLEIRSNLTENCYSMKKIYDSGLFTEVAIEGFESHTKNITSAGNTTTPHYRKEFRRKLLDLREGLRWLTLKNLTGGEEIYLLSTQLRARENGRKIGLLDIPYTLKHGNDEEFDGLMKLLQPSQSWIRKTLLQLRGMVGWIKELSGVCRSDRDPHSLSQLIQQTVNRTFEGIDLRKNPSGRDPSLEIESFFGASPDAVAEILRGIIKKGGNLNFNQVEDDTEDDSEDNSEDDSEDDSEEEEGIHEETSLLMKSIRSLLIDLPNAQECGNCPE
ncbi:uncharacterized protein TRUGW13939_06398 [Talaromyces rugulosus]|uniref:Zn(2)-C6 fungal-type domain-containing protein n=1 Tax=Talaromyces rugulosus TaxID=121627 RepID=A0A7H8QZS2_TALRU|nr:uncharacterized protein TRUGW13939_06398 [Talaromyces rugulosus]QKX59266.1 hypothetical protein TRUGW13939_06398 [Talaromyces rugulosus]